MYIRYIDDIFIIWQHGANELEEFVTHMNSSSEHIKFTSEISTTHIPFLDTLVELDGCKISTNLYTKPTDSHNYLYYDSAHPQRCKDSIPYSQFLRIRRICTHNTDFDKNVIELCKHFLRRKYPLELLHRAALLARSLDRQNLLNRTDTTTVETDDEKVFLITTYHPHDQFVPQTARNNWEILGRNQTTEELQNRKLVCGFSRPPNLRNILCTAKVRRLRGDELADPNYVAPTPPPPITNRTVGTTRQTSIKDYARPTHTENVHATMSLPTQPTRIPVPINSQGSRKRKDKRGFPYCGHNDCRYCRLLNKTGTIKSTTTGINHNTMKHISCRSSNVIYAITCRNCHIQYVGQTLLRLKDRFVGHFGDINNSLQDKPVGKHFSQGNHRGIDDVRISILEFIKMPPRSPQAATIRHRVETKWTIFN